MSGVTKEQIARAKAVPLLDYLLSNEGNSFKRVGKAYYRRDAEHNSLRIDNNLWYWHSHGIGGDIIDYLVKIKGYSFVDAVRRLADEDYSRQAAPPRARPPNAAKQAERGPLSLPPRNRDNNRVIDYLMERGVDRSLIECCIKRGLLYESGDGWHNCVFIGRDERGKARFAALRGTTSDFKRDADGSDKRFGFVLPPLNSASTAVMVFESPIDALSHQTICQDFGGWRLSLGGTSLPALTRFLEIHLMIERITVCTDNDEAGNRAAIEIAAKFSNYRVTRLLPPTGKDWNDALRSFRSEVNPLEDKRKDIIFRDGDYKEKFRIKDGESVKVTLGYNGEIVTLKCRWIDECHTKIGSEYYHVDEYAEKSARVGNVTEPVASGKPQIDILAAMYGEALQDVTVPMTEAALRKLVGSSYETETLCYPDRTEQIRDRKVEIKGKAFGAVLRGKDGIAVCGLTDGVLTSLHPYNAQTCRRELSPAAPLARDTSVKKESFLGSLESAKAIVAEQNAAKAEERAERPQKRGAERGD